jgi:hypothetical protein
VEAIIYPTPYPIDRLSFCLVDRFHLILIMSIISVGSVGDVKVIDLIKKTLLQVSYSTYTKNSEIYLLTRMRFS